MNRSLNFLKLYSVRSTVILLLLISFSHSVQAQQSFYIHDDEMDIGIVPRISTDESEASIVTTDGMVELLLAGNDVVIQFSEKKLDRITDEIKNENSSASDSHFEAVLKSMLSSGVRTLLDRGIAIPLYEISDISYENNRLIIRNMQGIEIFEDLEIENKPVMEQFSRREARRFITAVERKMI